MSAFTWLFNLDVGDDTLPPVLGVPSVKKLAEIVYICSKLLLSGSISNIRADDVNEAVILALVVKVELPTGISLPLI